MAPKAVWVSGSGSSCCRLFFADPATAWVTAGMKRYAQAAEWRVPDVPRLRRPSRAGAEVDGISIREVRAGTASELDSQTVTYKVIEVRQ